MQISPLPLPKIAMALLAAAAIPVAHAAAQTTTFVIDGTEGSSTYTNTTNGITLSLSDPAEEISGSFAFGIDTADGDSGMGELNLSSPDYGFVTAFDFSFSSDVQIVSYTIGVNDGSGTGGVFSLSGGGGPASTGNVLTVGTDDVNGAFSIGAGLTGSFDTGGSIPDDSLPSIESITVELVPEPGSWPLLVLGGLGTLAALRRRRAQKTG